MNIAVLGSNCKFSSSIAAKLNKLKKTSLVYRYDALADFKKSIPLYASLLSETRFDKGPVDDVDTPTEERLQKGSVPHLGEYIGDVETQFAVCTDKVKETVDALRVTFNALNVKVKNQGTYGSNCVDNKLKEVKRNSDLLKANTLNIINVFSGIITQDMLTSLLEHSPLTLVVKVKSSDTFLPCTITEEDLNEVKKKYLQTIVLEVSSLDELFKNNFIISTFNLEKEKIEKKPVEEEKKMSTEEYGVLLHADPILHRLDPNIIHVARQGILAQAA
jgi:hypothetical protein